MFHTATSHEYRHGWQKRVFLDSNTLDTREGIIEEKTTRPSLIRQALQLWSGRYDFGRKPVDIEEAEQDELFRGLATALIHVPDDPWKSYFVRHQGVVQGMQGKSLSEFPLPEMADAAILEYIDCIDAGAPHTHHIRASFPGIRRDYIRVVLPLRSRCRRQNMLLSVCQHLSPAHRESDQAIHDQLTTPT